VLKRDREGSDAAERRLRESISDAQRDAEAQFDQYQRALQAAADGILVEFEAARRRFEAASRRLVEAAGAAATHLAETAESVSTRLAEEASEHGRQSRAGLGEHVVDAEEALQRAAEGAAAEARDQILAAVEAALTRVLEADHAQERELKVRAEVRKAEERLREFRRQIGVADQPDPA
jgi:hypothetical protein